MKRLNEFRCELEKLDFRIDDLYVSENERVWLEMSRNYGTGISIVFRKYKNKNNIRINDELIDNVDELSNINFITSTDVDELKRVIDYLETILISDWLNIYISYSQVTTIPPHVSNLLNYIHTKKIEYYTPYGFDSTMRPRLLEFTYTDYMDNYIKFIIKIEQCEIYEKITNEKLILQIDVRFEYGKLRDWVSLENTIEDVMKNLENFTLYEIKKYLS